jgi:hypothetical protein
MAFKALLKANLEMYKQMIHESVGLAVRHSYAKC